MYGLFNIDEAFWLVASPRRATQPKTEEYVVGICCCCFVTCVTEQGKGADCSAPVVTLRCTCQPSRWPRSQGRVGWKIRAEGDHRARLSRSDRPRDGL